jgi:phosphoribosylamine--glycine ligase
MVAGGYPGSYAKGKEIYGLDEVSESLVFHAGTKIEKDKVVTNGGRVVAVTSLSKDLQDALEISYRSVEKISWENFYYRKDIGKDILALNNS